MNEDNYEQAATPTTNSDSSSLQPLGIYEQAASVKGPDISRSEKPALSRLNAEDYASLVESPLSGEEVALKIAQLNEAGIDINESTINIEEFKAYDEWRKKQHFDFWGAIGDGVVQTGKDLGKGVASAATDWKKAALAAGLSATFTPAVGLSVAYGQTALEAFWRGTRDLGGLFVMAANHPSSPLYRMFINPTGDVNQSYQDFLDLSSWNAQSEKIISGKSNALMPDRETYEKLFGKAFGGQVDDFIGVNKELATAASYILDPTVFFTFGATSASKAGAKAIANKTAAAGIKAGQAGAHVTGAVAARASRNAMKTTFLNSLGEGMVKFSDTLSQPLETGYRWLADNVESITGGGKLKPSGTVGHRKVTPNKGHGPSSFAHATLGSLGIYSLFSIPYAVPAASIYAGIKAVGFAGEALAKTGTKAALGTGASAVAKGIQMSTPLAMYFSDLAKTTAHGSLYGGLIGGFAAGEEGAAGGIGTGATLGAIGHNVALGAGTITGQFARMAQRSQFDSRVKYLEEKGHLLKAKNLRKFVDDIKTQLGEDAGDRLMGEILALEQGKNVDTAYFTPEDMQKAWESDPDYWTEVDDGQGGKKRVLTDLGAEIRRNAEAGGTSWNGLFMEIDPKTGKAMESPILTYKDKKSGRWKVIINTEAMKYVRNADGTLKTVTETVKGKRQVVKEKTTMVEGAREYTETIEGPRPRALPSDPTVPRDEAGKPLPPETPKDVTPEPVTNKDVNTGEDFVPPPIETKETRQSESRQQQRLERLIEVKLGDAVKVYDLNTRQYREKLIADGYTDAQIDKALDSINKKVEARKNKNAPKREKLSKQQEEFRKKRQEFEARQAELDKNPDAEKQAKLNEEIRQNEADAQKAESEAKAFNDYGENAKFDINVDEMVWYLKQFEPKDRAKEFEADLVNRFEKFFDTGIEGQRTPEQQKNFEKLKGILEKRLKEEGLMSKDGKFESTKKQTTPTSQAQVAETNRRNAKYEAKWEPNSDGDSVIKDKNGKVGGRVYKKYNGWWYADADGNGFGQEFRSEAEAKAFAESRLQVILEEKAFADSQPHSQQVKNSLVQSEQAVNTDGTVDIVYSYNHYNDDTGKYTKGRAKARIVDGGGRKIVMKSINGVLVPFYLSTGEGGKKTVPAGKWYPFFGVSEKGWINKLSEADIRDYYGSPEFKKAAEELDASIGDIREKQGYPRITTQGEAARTINKNGKLGVESKQPDTYEKVKANVETLKAEIAEASKNAPEVPKPVAETPKAPEATKPTEAPAKPVSVEARAPQTAPALKSRVRSRNKGVELQGPGKPIEIKRVDRSAVPKVEKFTVEEEGTWEVRKPVMDLVNTQVVSELYHVMNRVRRRVEHGTEIDTVVRNWLFGDGETYKGAFNGDRKKTVEFMMEAYKRLVGPRAGSTDAVEWKQTIDEYERTGKITPNTQEAFEKFIEEVGEAMFIGWEQGKPFDFIPKGGDLGMLRNFVETLKDSWANYVERTAVNMGADVNTKQAFFDWFKKNKQGGKFKFDPYVEKAFTDLVRVYADKGMKDNGISKANLYQLPPAAIKDQIERYGLEELATQDKDGNWTLKPMEEVHREQQQRGQQFAYEFAEAIEKDPSIADGMNIFVSDEYIPVNSPEAEGKINAGMDALEKRSMSGFDPNTMQTLDTQGTKGKGFLFSSGDFDEVGPSLDDLVQAQVKKSRRDGIYKDRGYNTFGARGRPRTTPSGRLGADMKKALASGRTLIFRGIPTEKAFALLEKHFPKSVSKNVRVIAPIIVDGGRTKSNVLRGTYLGFQQAQDDGTILYRDRGDQFSAREATFVPYDMEFRITLRNPKNPEINYKQPHFAAITRIFDVDGMNTRAHHIWRESKDLQGMYGHINEYLSDVYNTVDAYSASGLIPAVDFFGADEWARDKRKFVMAALGANPTKEMKATYSAAEADWSEYQHKKGRVGIQGNMHTWKSFRLDNFRNIVSVDNESVPLRVNDKVYRRALIPTPVDGEGAMYDAMYSAPDGPIELIIENLRDFHESTGEGEYNHLKLIKNLNDPMKLVKRLEKAPESSYKEAKSMFNAADTFGGVDPEEIKFLKSNYEWAVQQGDIMLAESMKRYMAQFGKDVILIRHTLEEHLAAGGTIEDYNKDIATGVPVVFPVQHGTGSEAFLRDPVFKPEFLGKTTGAASAKLGYFFAGLQETANSYSALAGYRPFKNLPEGLIIATDVHLKANDMRREFASAIKAMAKRGDSYEQIVAALRSLRSNHKTNIELAAKEMGEKSLVPKFAQEAKSINTSLDRTIYSKVFSAPLIKAEMELARLNADVDLIEDLLMNTGYDFNTLLEDWKLKDLDDGIRDEAWDSIQDSLRMEQKLLDAEGLGKSKRKPITKEQFDAYWYQQQSEFRVEQDVDSLDFISSEWNRYFHPEINPSLMMRSFVGFKNPYVYDFKGQGRSAGPRFGQIYKTALANGHDGIILKNIHDRGPNDNIVSIAMGKENQIAVTDTSLSKAPAPRNSGYKEGGKYLASAGDTLPEGAFGPNNPETVHLARSFKKSKGFDTGDGSFIVKLDTDKSFRIGMAYEEMKHEPFNPKVREAYTQFAKETLEQFDHIVEAGYRPEMHISEREPYGSSREAIASIKDKKTLKVLSTDLNFGERKVTEADIKENPLLAMTKYKDINGVPMRVNDIFRFVHDFFGHSERGNSFGPLGEENAWDVHARMYSPLARKAMTAGTRGQNSWVNFIYQPNIEGNRKRDMVRRLEREGRLEEAAAIRATIPKTQFARQKIGLLPDWASKFDSEMTPMERKVFGTHVVKKNVKGFYSAGDSVEHVWNPDAEEFSVRGAEARASSKFGTSVEIKNPEDYKGYELLMIGEGRAMASISPSGELGSVLKGIDGTTEDVQRVMEAALATGKVRWLNAFDTVLPRMYQKFGFEAVARIRFVDEYRPDGWDYEKYGKFNGGRPDVVFMAYVGPEAMSYDVFRGVEVANYDDAVAITHARVEEGKGMFSAGDIYSFDDFTEQTKADLDYVNLIKEYAELNRAFDIKEKNNELTRDQISMQLRAWHGRNKTGQTVMSWAEFRIGKDKVKVSELTPEHIEQMIVDIKAKDKNWKKQQAQFIRSESARAKAEARALQSSLEEQVNQEPTGPETNLQRIKRLRREKVFKDGITMLEKVREWNEEMDKDEATGILKTMDKDYEKRLKEKEEANKRVEMLQKLRERRVDKIMLRYADENAKAEASGQELPHIGDAEMLYQKALNEAVMDEQTVEFDEDLVKTQLEEEKLSKEERQRINKEIERQVRGGESVVIDETGEKVISYEKEIDEDLYEQLLDAGEDERKAWKKARKAFLDSIVIQMEMVTLEDAIAELRRDNEEYAKNNEGEVLWTEEEIEKEAFARVQLRNETIQVAKGVIKTAPEKGAAKGSLDYMAKVQFANTEWFDGEGEPLVWKGETSNKEYRGQYIREKKGKEFTGRVFIGETLLDEEVTAVYPPEMQKVVDDLDNKVKEMLNGKANGNFREKLLLVLDLYSLWGYEVNQNLLDDTFVPKRSLMREQGLTGQALSREMAAARGDFITGFDVEAKFSERLDALPDLYNLTKDLLSDVIQGAEYTARQQLDIWIMEETQKGRTPTDAQIRAKKKEFKTSDISFEKDFVSQLIRDFARSGEFELSASDLLVTNSDEYFKLHQKERRREARRKLTKKLEKEGKKPTSEQIASAEKEVLDALKIEAEDAVGLPSKFLGEEKSVESQIFTRLWNKNEETRKLFSTLTGKQKRQLLSKKGYKELRRLKVKEGKPKTLVETKNIIRPLRDSERTLKSNEALRIEARALARAVRFKFIEYLHNKTNPLLFEIARNEDIAAGRIELSPTEKAESDSKARKKAIEEASQAEGDEVLTPEQVQENRRAKAKKETVATPEPVVTPEVVTPPATETPKTPSYKDSPAQREKDRNASALAAAIAKADREGKSRPVPTLGPLLAAVQGSGTPKKTPAPAKAQTPQQLGYKVSADNLTAMHPSGRFSVTKEGGMYSVKEGTASRAVFKSFADAHKFIDEKLKAQTPPPAPVGRPSTPKTPEPIKKQVEATAQAQIKNNTVKPPEVVGQAQALCIAENLAALDPKNHEATATVLNIDDELTLKVDQLSNKTATTADKRYTATRTRTGIRVVMNPHVDPVTKQQVKGSKIGEVQTAEQAQLLIREHAHNQRRLLEQQGVDVGGVLQAENPVITPAQVEQVTTQVVQQVPPQPPVVAPKVKAETHPDYTTAVAALQVLGVKVTDAKDRIKKAIDDLGMSADKQAIIKHALAQGAPQAQRIANSNQVHVATVNANPTPVTPQVAATVVILPSNSGTVAATGASIPPAPKVNTPPAITTPPVVGPTLPASTLTQVSNATKFVPRRSRYVLASGVQADGITYTNSLGYMIVQSGISKWRCFNPAASLLSVTDNEQEAVDAILRDLFKR
jgi:hypothetical protein